MTEVKPQPEFSPGAYPPQPGGYPPQPGPYPPGPGAPPPGVYPPPVVESQPMQSNTMVIVQQPGAQYGPRDWSSSLFGCFDDLPICLCGWFCGVCLACQVSQGMDESLCVPLCLPLPVAILRTKWRTQNQIQGSIMEDCLMNTFCGACSLCQLARDVKAVKGKI